MVPGVNEKQENKPVESSDDKPILDAVKRLSVVEDQDKYSIAVSKYINIDDYLSNLLNVTHYEVQQRSTGKYKIVFYNRARVVKVIHNCVCKDSTFYLPRLELSQRRCYLYSLYLNFRLL